MVFHIQKPPPRALGIPEKNGDILRRCMILDEPPERWLGGSKDYPCPKGK